MSEERMAALKAMTDDDIDYSDTPSQEGKQGRRVGGPRFGAPQNFDDLELVLTAVPEDPMVALEPDVLQFFKETGDASSARVNAALREYAETHRKSA
jgi:uncharacterized protein (DUF4415 family)